MCMSLLILVSYVTCHKSVTTLTTNNNNNNNNNSDNGNEEWQWQWRQPNGNGSGADQTTPPLTCHALRAMSTANDDPQWNIEDQHSRLAGGVFAHVCQRLRKYICTCRVGLPIIHHHRACICVRPFAHHPLGTSPSGDESVIQPTVS